MTRSGGSSGFTLLEVLVALALLGIAVTVIFQLFSADTRNIALSGDYVSAVVRAEARMVEVLDSEPIAESSWSEVTNEGYAINVVISDTTSPGAGELPMKLLRVDLTIRWKNGAKQKSMTLRSLKMAGRKV